MSYLYILVCFGAALISAVNKPKSSEPDLIECMQLVKQTKLECYDTSIDNHTQVRIASLTPVFKGDLAVLGLTRSYDACLHKRIRNRACCYGTLEKAHAEKSSIDD